MQNIVSKYSGRLRKMIEQERKQTPAISESSFQINGFPGGPLGFELAVRFCYNNGEVVPMITPSNLPLLHSSAIFLEMDEDAAECNLLHQADTFLDGLFYLAWSDVLASLKACEPLYSSVQSSGLLDKLLSSLLVKIAAGNSDAAYNTGASSSSSSSSPDVVRFSSSTKTPDSVKSGSGKAWWFDDLTTLSPSIIEKMLKIMGVYGSENNSLVLTRFLLHYLKTAAQRPSSCHVIARCEYGGLADTAVNGVVLMGRTAFTCRGLLWVLRVVSNLGLGKDCRGQLERLIGGMLDQATLDDVLVSGHDDGGGVYDVNLVLRLLRVFATGEDGMCLQRMKKVGRLMDKYMGEISPDPGLKVSKFLAVAESLPDAARDCFDGVYRAIDIYFEVPMFTILLLHIIITRKMMNPCHLWKEGPN